MNLSADLALARLLQLASPTLPVGAYSYSQGLEAAVECGAVLDAASAERWIGDLLEHGMARLEAPLWVRLHAAWLADDEPALARWNAYFIATRETAELRAETLQMGYSLARLFAALDAFDAAALERLARLDLVSYPAAFAFAVAQWRIDPRAALLAYLWSWLENQTMAALKAVPLGQTDGQRMLARLGGALPETAARCLATDDGELCNFTPAFAILSAQHETQYSRLFRS